MLIKGEKGERERAYKKSGKLLYVLKQRNVKDMG